ncbi:uncharacterized protein EV422DRAFT_517192 [Fimicolochytrium jonesii]|uniref:uncharacterized protein n=1 Tax=Fimicolochytrium jonesii TaxID=1396493 RepID=UPI0022FE874E|nr:uncharacterized protein EV422DRAFT_517192 [Fimicolochytrium jonesii]KAI8825035.1 hypothetical protein EV422DRAFT_517192 [Fimicolochytrium jonesii]
MPARTTTATALRLLATSTILLCFLATPVASQTTSNPPQGDCFSFPTPPQVVSTALISSPNASVRACALQCLALTPPRDRTALSARSLATGTTISCACFQSDQQPASSVPPTGTCGLTCTQDNLICGSNRAPNAFVVYVSTDATAVVRNAVSAATPIPGRPTLTPSTGNPGGVDGKQNAKIAPPAPDSPNSVAIVAGVGLSLLVVGVGMAYYFYRKKILRKGSRQDPEDMTVPVGTVSRPDGGDYLPSTFVRTSDGQPQSTLPPQVSIVNIPGDGQRKEEKSASKPLAASQTSQILQVQNKAPTNAQDLRAPRMEQPPQMQPTKPSTTQPSRINKPPQITDSFLYVAEAPLLSNPAFRGPLGGPTNTGPKKPPTNEPLKIAAEFSSRALGPAAIAPSAEPNLQRARQMGVPILQSPPNAKTYRKVDSPTSDPEHEPDVLAPPVRTVSMPQKATTAPGPMAVRTNIVQIAPRVDVSVLSSTPVKSEPSQISFSSQAPKALLPSPPVAVNQGPMISPSGSSLLSDAEKYFFRFSGLQSYETTNSPGPPNRAYTPSASGSDAPDAIRKSSLVTPNKALSHVSSSASRPSSRSSTKSVRFDMPPPPVRAPRAISARQSSLVNFRTSENKVFRSSSLKEVITDVDITGSPEKGDTPPMRNGSKLRSEITPDSPSTAADTSSNTQQQQIDSLMLELSHIADALLSGNSMQSPAIRDLTLAPERDVSSPKLLTGMTDLYEDLNRAVEVGWEVKTEVADRSEGAELKLPGGSTPVKSPANRDLPLSPETRTPSPEILPSTTDLYKNLTFETQNISPASERVEEQEEDEEEEQKEQTPVDRALDLPSADPKHLTSMTDLYGGFSAFGTIDRVTKARRGSEASSDDGGWGFESADAFDRQPEEQVQEQEEEKERLTSVGSADNRWEADSQTREEQAEEIVNERPASVVSADDRWDAGIMSNQNMFAPDVKHSTFMSELTSMSDLYGGVAEPEFENESDDEDIAPDEPTPTTTAVPHTASLRLSTASFAPNNEDSQDLKRLISVSEFYGAYDEHDQPRRRGSVESDGDSEVRSFVDEEDDDDDRVPVDEPTWEVQQPRREDPLRSIAEEAVIVVDEDPDNDTDQTPTPPTYAPTTSPTTSLPLTSAQPRAPSFTPEELALLQNLPLPPDIMSDPESPTPTDRHSIMSVMPDLPARIPRAEVAMSRQFMSPSPLSSPSPRSAVVLDVREEVEKEGLEEKRLEFGEDIC